MRATVLTNWSPGREAAKEGHKGKYPQQPFEEGLPRCESERNVNQTPQSDLMREWKSVKRLPLSVWREKPCGIYAMRDVTVNCPI